MRVLVTGATGFLGSHLCKKLIWSGHETTALHRSNSRTTAIQSLGARLIEGDLADLEGLRRAVSGHDVVIHAAADIQSWPRQPDLQTRINVDASRNVAAACRSESVGRMIHVSSVSAIGIPDEAGSPVDEEFRFNLSGPGFHYHLSKKLAEEAVLNEVSSGLDAVIVNPGSLFGRYGDRYRGAEILRKVTRGRVIPCFSGGRCIVHVSDAVDGIFAAIRDGVRGNRYILGGENVSYREIARRTAKAFHLNPWLVSVPAWCLGAVTVVAAQVGRVQSGRPPFAAHFLDNYFQYYSWNKAGRALAYAPRTFDGIIADFMAWRESREDSNAA